MANAEATRERILEAALAEFSAYGVAGARVDRIARTAGCNKNLIYIYFENKETLFSTVLQKNLSRVYEDMAFAPDDVPGFAGRVFDFARDRPDLLRLLAWSTLEQTAQPASTRATAQEKKVEALRSEQQAGRLSIRFSTEFLMTAIMSLATAWSGAFPFGAPLEVGEASRAAELRENLVHAVSLISEEGGVRA